MSLVDTLSQILEQAPPANELLARGGTGGSCGTVAPVSIKPRTFAICDTQPLTGIGIRSVVAEVADLRLLVAVDSLEAARVVIHLHAPDVMVIDKAFGDKAILEWLRRTRPAHSRSRVVIWGVSFVRGQALGLVRAGARGILRKTAPAPAVLDCLGTVASGRTWFDGSAGPAVARAGQPADFRLTAREGQVAKLVERGLNNRQIGRRLGISPGTVKVHLKRVLRKAAAPDRFGLSLSALQRQLSGESLALEDAGFGGVSCSEALIEAHESIATCGAQAPSSERPIVPEPARFQPELRREPRTPIREAASLHVFNPLVAGCWGVMAADRSLGGLQVIGPYPISIGALVQVRLASALVLGQVRHCAAVADGFRIGIFVENSMFLKSRSVA